MSDNPCAVSPSSHRSTISHSSPRQNTKRIKKTNAPTHADCQSIPAQVHNLSQQATAEHQEEKQKRPKPTRIHCKSSGSVVWLGALARWFGSMVRCLVVWFGGLARWSGSVVCVGPRSLTAVQGRTPRIFKNPHPPRRGCAVSPPMRCKSILARVHNLSQQSKAEHQEHN